ncbi:PDZ domain-containing protein [Oryctes borbonicus]|uniref:PDZ domain-containing protein n=1 Tax=Oryctes borbonicus TaxID=1629725 RepID=A0A0T6B261_9SCAR|nr:PDZ domain-containing protein [Oryctes borbonicus]
MIFFCRLKMLKHVVTGKKRHKGTNTEDDCTSAKFDNFLHSNSGFTCNCTMIRIIIDRAHGKSLGIKVVGGKKARKGVFISSILESGAIHENGVIQEGDEILAINNHPMGNTTALEDALMIIKKIKRPYVIVYVARRVSQFINK